MKKPVFAMLLGGVLGVFDGLSALLTAPEDATNDRRHRGGLDIQGRDGGLDRGLGGATHAIDWP